MSDLDAIMDVLETHVQNFISATVMTCENAGIPYPIGSAAIIERMERIVNSLKAGKRAVDLIREVTDK